MRDFGSAAHQALVSHVSGHYAGDPRVRAIIVFGSVATGAWHELSDGPGLTGAGGARDRAQRSTSAS